MPTVNGEYLLWTIPLYCTPSTYTLDLGVGTLANIDKKRISYGKFEGKTYQWYCNTPSGTKNPVYQANASGYTYYWIAFG